MKNQFTKKGKTLWLLVVACCFYGCNSNTSKEATDSASVAKDSVATGPSTDNALDTIHLCTEMLPPSRPGSGITTTTDTAIYFRNHHVNDTLISSKITSFQRPVQGAPMRAAIWKPFIWKHTNLTVMFLDGDPAVQDRVKSTAKEWEKYCGIHFIFGRYTSADITISFKYKGSWSYIGNYSTVNSPSMNLGWLQANTSQEEYDRVVLHEFGHAIGFIHEHQNPNGNPIQWNKPVVYAYYNAPPNNWDKNDVDNNIFKKYAVDEINSSVFDPNSIMLYAFPTSLTTNHYSTHSNSKISEADKKYAAETYPIGM